MEKRRRVAGARAREVMFRVLSSIKQSLQNDHFLALKCVLCRLTYVVIAIQGLLKKMNMYSVHSYIGPPFIFSAFCSLKSRQNSYIYGLQFYQTMSLCTQTKLLQYSTKQIPSYTLFLSNASQKLKIKLFSKRTKQTSTMQIWSEQYSYQQLPSILQLNFANLDEVFSQLKQTHPQKFTFRSHAILEIHMQIGSKSKTYFFKLKPKEFTYTQQIQYMLYVMQKNSNEINYCKADASDLNNLKGTIQRQSREIGELSGRLMQQRQKIQYLEEMIAVILQSQGKKIFPSHQHYHQTQNAGQNQKNAQKTLHSEQQSQADNKETTHLNHQNRKQTHNTNVTVISSKSSQSGNRDIRDLQICQAFEPFFMDKQKVHQAQSGAFYRVGQKFKLKRGDGSLKQVNSLTHISLSRARVGFRLLHTKGHNIWVGLVVYDRINARRTKRDKGAISCKLSGGKVLFQDGLHTGEQIQLINEKDEIAVQVDYLCKKMTWYKNCVRMVNRRLPLRFTGEKMYPFVTMVDEGDEVEIV